MLVIGPIYAKYGASKTFYFSLEDVTDAEAPFTGTAPLTADIWVVKNGGTPASATNAAAHVGNGVYSWVATAAELSAEQVNINIYDATATAIFKPVAIIVETTLSLGKVLVDAEAMTGDVNAIYARGKDGGKGIDVWGGDTGGAGIRSIGGVGGGEGLKLESPKTTALYILGSTDAAEGTDSTVVIEHFSDGVAVDIRGKASGAAIRAVGGDTAHGIEIRGGATSGNGIDSRGNGSGSGANFVGTGTNNGLNAIGASASYHNNIFEQSEGTQLTGTLDSTTTYRRILQALKRRWFNRHTCSSAELKVYQDDSTTVLSNQTVDGSGSTLEINKST